MRLPPEDRPYSLISMLFSKSIFRLALGPAIFCLVLPNSPGENPGIPAGPKPPRISSASDEGERAMKRFEVAPGFKVELFAAEPYLANPVAFHVDEKGRFYVVETFRLH